jgi:hypothetical protein
MQPRRLNPHFIILRGTVGGGEAGLAVFGIEQRALAGVVEKTGV